MALYNTKRLYAPVGKLHDKELKRNVRLSCKTKARTSPKQNCSCLGE